MYCNNKYINSNFISPINLDLKFNIKNEQTCSFLAKIIPIFYKENNYFPNSEEIINIINRIKILDYEVFKIYIKKNKSYFIPNSFDIELKKSCLVSYCFDSIDESWIKENSKIFDYVYIITYTKLQICIDNVKIIYSYNDKKNYLLDLFFFLNDIKQLYNYLFFLEPFQVLSISINNHLDTSHTEIKNYIDLLKFNKYNFSYYKYFIKLKNELYEKKNNNLCFFTLNQIYGIINNKIYYSRRVKNKNSPLCIIDKCFEEENFIQFQNFSSKKLEEPNLLYKFIYFYKKNNLLETKIQLGDVNKLILKNNFIHFINPPKIKLQLKSNSLENNYYDYQFLDESIIIILNDSIENDLVVLCSAIVICRKFQKKLFIDWRNSVCLSDILNENYYSIEDSIEKLNDKKFNIYNNLNSKNINHMDNISYLENPGIFCDDKENLLKIWNNLNWKPKIINLLNKINSNINLNKSFSIDLNPENLKICNEYLQINERFLINFKKNQKGSVISLNDDNKFHKLIKFIISVKSSYLVNDKNFHINEIYKLFLENNIIDFKKIMYENQVLNYNGKKLTYTKYINNSNYLYEEEGIQSGVTLITYKFNNEISNKITKSYYYDSAFIIDESKQKIPLNYKIKYVHPCNNYAILLNNMIRIFKYDKILISKFLVDQFFFKYHKLNGKNFYFSKDLSLIYFDLNQYHMINGFNENIDNNLVIIDFICRLKLFKFESENLEEKYNLNLDHKSNLINDYTLSEVWGKENMKIKMKFKKINNKLFLV